VCGFEKSPKAEFLSISKVSLAMERKLDKQYEKNMKLKKKRDP